MKAKRIIQWTLIVLILFSIGVGGVAKLFRVDFFVQNARQLHYSAEFMQFIAFWEVVGCVGLLFNRYRIWAALGLICIMIGAVGVSVGAQTELSHYIGPAVLALILVVIIALDNAYRIEYRKLSHESPSK